MSFVVLYDACVLYPAPLRDLLMRTAASGIVQAKWSEQILDECFRNVLKDRPDLNPASLSRTRELMCTAIADCLVTNYEGLIEGLDLPDPDDRHVLAAAIHASAQVIVTFNLKDFPASALEVYSIEAKHPDDFVLESIDISPGGMVQVVIQQASALRSPPRTIHDLLDTLRNQGIPRSVARLRELLT